MKIQQARTSRCIQAVSMTPPFVWRLHTWDSLLGVHAGAWAPNWVRIQQQMTHCIVFNGQTRSGWPWRVGQQIVSCSQCRTVAHYSAKWEVRGYPTSWHLKPVEIPSTRLVNRLMRP